MSSPLTPGLLPSVNGSQTVHLILPRLKDVASKGSGGCPRGDVLPL